MTRGSAKDPTEGGEALRGLREDLRLLVREELATAQQDLLARARQTRKAAAMLAGAGILGGMAIGTAAAVLTRALDRMLPRTVAALVATGVYGGGAAALSSAGIAELNRAGAAMSRELVEGVRADVRAAAKAAGADPRGAES